MTTIGLNTKIGEVENKIPHHAKYITTQEFNSSTAGHFTARLKQANPVSKTNFDNKLIILMEKLHQIKQNIQKLKKD